MSRSDNKELKQLAMGKVRLVEAILRRWDPIRVEPGVVAPADEYDGYAPRIVSMVEGGCSVEDLVAYLEQLGSVAMGVGPSTPESVAHSRESAVEIVGALGRLTRVGADAP